MLGAKTKAPAVRAQRKARRRSCPSLASAAVRGQGRSTGTDTARRQSTWRLRQLTGFLKASGDHFVRPALLFTIVAHTIIATPETMFVFTWLVLATSIAAQAFNSTVEFVIDSLSPAVAFIPSEKWVYDAVTRTARNTDVS